MLFSALYYTFRFGFCATGVLVNALSVTGKFCDCFTCFTCFFCFTFFVFSLLGNEKHYS